MKCKEMRYQLPDYVRGMTPDEAGRKLEEHLRVCPACQEEARLLTIQFAECAQDPTWNPAAAYWQTILPQVHKRIDRSSSDHFPNRISRFALPVAAAIAVFLLAVQLVPWPGSGMAQDISSSIRQMSPEDLQDFAEQQIIVGAVDPPSLPGDRALNTDDILVLRELFQAGEWAFTNSTHDQDAIFDIVSDQDVDELVPLLEEKSQSNID